MTDIFSKEPYIHGLHYSEETGFRAYFGESPNERTYLALTTDELVQTHPDLPELTAYLCERYKLGNENAHIPSVSFKTILREWTSPAPQLQDTEGKTRSVSAMYSCMYTSDKKNLTVHTSYYESEEWWPSSGLQPVPVVLSRGSKTFNVSVSYLDRNYPGWEQRYSEAQALDISPEMLVEHMFRTPALPLDIPMSGITFD